MGLAMSSLGVCSLDLLEKLKDVGVVLPICKSGVISQQALLESIRHRNMNYFPCLIQI